MPIQDPDNNSLMQSLMDYFKNNQQEAKPDTSKIPVPATDAYRAEQAAKPVPVPAPVADDDSEDDTNEVSTPKKITQPIADQAEDDDSSDESDNSDQIPMSAAAPKSNPIDLLLGKQASAFQQAQEQRHHMRMMGLIGQAAAQIGQGFSGVKSATPVSDSYVKNADEGLTDLKSKENLDAATLKNAQTKLSLTTDTEKADPDSDISKLYRNVLDQMGYKVSDSASASSVAAAFPAIEKYAAMQQRQQMQRDLKEGKGTDKQNAATQQTISLLESARGNPEVSQALKNKLLVKNAQGLINQYPNPDQMSPPEVQLLVTEIGKIASGGVPAEKELQAMMPNTMRSKLAAQYSKFINAPSPAEAGSFVKMYNRYLQELDTNATDAINNKYNRVLEGKKNSIGQSNYDVLKNNYMLKPLENKSSDTIQSKELGDKEPAVQAFMKANNIKDRNQAIQILKDNGRL